MRSIGFLSALAALAPAVTGQFVEPPKDLKTKMGFAGINVRYKQVPNGICETRAHVKSYSGYADVGKNQHIFFWFFEAREADPTEAPLTAWINGGPGSSSMIGLFQELGPCGVDKSGKLYDNPYAWNQKSNMIFIDQPATTGFSYTKTTDAYLDDSGEVIPLNGTKCPAAHADACGTYSVPNEKLVPGTTQDAAPAFWKTIQGFMGAFPQYSRHGFNFATESYGGHYGPVFNEYIEQQNAHLPKGAKEIHLEAVLIGNGWFDPSIQYASYYNYSVSNTYGYRPYNETIKKQVLNNLYGKGKCLDQLANCKRLGTNKVCADADTYCATNVESIWDDVTNRDEYDMRELMPDPFPYNFYPKYLNTERVQKAIGAFTNFSDFSATVGDAYGVTGDDGRESNTIEDSRALIEQGVYFVNYVGDADYICNWIGNRVVSDVINAPGYKQSGYADIKTGDGIVHGQVRQSKNFAFVRIYEAGHEVPFYQPLVSLDMFNRVLCGLDIETGTKSVWHHNYRTNGPKESTYQEGNGTVITHVVPDSWIYNTKTNKPQPPS